MVANLSNAKFATVTGLFATIASCLLTFALAKNGLAMTDDPCDPFDGWRWSCTSWVTADSDPCDEWPTLRVGGECFFISSFGIDFGVADAAVIITDVQGRDIDFVAFDEFANFYKVKPEPRDTIRDYDLSRLIKRELAACPPDAPYDFRKHDKVKGKRGRW